MVRARTLGIVVVVVAVTLAYDDLYGVAAAWVSALPVGQRWAIALPAHLVPIALAYGGALALWRKAAPRELWLVPPMLAPFGVALAALVSTVLVLATAPGASLQLPLDDLLFLAVIPGIAEELLFRGVVLGALQRDLRLGFWPAAILSSLAFGAAHLIVVIRSREWGLLAITAAGGLYFAWLRGRWRTLAAPIAMHALMDAAWVIVGVPSAVGDSRAQLARVGGIVVGVALTKRLTQKIDEAK